MIFCLCVFFKVGEKMSVLRFLTIYVYLVFLGKNCRILKNKLLTHFDIQGRLKKLFQSLHKTPRLSFLLKNTDTFHRMRSRTRYYTHPLYQPQSKIY